MTASLAAAAAAEERDAAGDVCDAAAGAAGCAKAGGNAGVGDRGKPDAGVDGRGAGCTGTVFCGATVMLIVTGLLVSAAGEPAEASSVTAHMKLSEPE